MSVSTTSSSSGLLGQYETQASQTTKTGSASLGKNDFLSLLVKQMQTQDPLNPMDDKEFVAQLAQFSSLEQLTNISSGIDKLNTATNQQQMFSAVNFIGKQVKALGSTVSKAGSTVSSLTYTLKSPANKVTMNIFDSNGNIIQQITQGAQTVGEHTFQWDGKDSLGRSVADGNYKVGVTVSTDSGGSTLVETTVTGLVTGVSTDTDGSYLLTTKDGRTVRMNNVQGVVSTN